MGIRDWKGKASERAEWRTIIVKQAKTRKGFNVLYWNICFWQTLGLYSVLFLFHLPVSIVYSYIHNIFCKCVVLSFWIFSPLSYIFIAILYLLGFALFSEDVYKPHFEYLFIYFISRKFSSKFVPHQTYKYIFSFWITISFLWVIFNYSVYYAIQCTYTSVPSKL